MATDDQGTDRVTPGVSPAMPGEEAVQLQRELAVVNDELRHRNLELSRTNNDLTNLLASVNMALVMLGPDLRIRRFTRPAERILNLVQTDVGRPITEIKLNLDVHDLEAIIADVIDSATTREREVRHRNDRWYSLRVRPYRTFDEGIDGAVMMLVDIDDLKRAEQAIRESERRFEVLADTAPVLIWMDDLDGCRFVNRAFEEFVGETEGDIRQLGHGAFVHPDDRHAYVEGYAEAMRCKERFEMRMRLQRADGEYRWMKTVAMPRFVSEGQLIGYVGITFDITDMAEAEAALRELDRGKNEFLAVLAHELRNPLSGVRNASRLLDDPHQADALRQARGIIDRQTEHMTRMVDDLLDMSRITYGKIQLRTEPLDILPILQAAVQATEGQRKEMSQTLEVQLAGEPLMVDGDAVRLEQVFNNLLGNASRFSRRGGRIWLTAEREPVDGKQILIVRVRDNGVGIEPSLLPRIFELFVQAGEVTERSRSGIGLGLTLAKRLVDLHGGTVEAHSAGPSLGSEFVVRLPLLARSAGVAQKQNAAAKPAPPHRVLIVDDNADSGGSLRLLLARGGHDVRLVEEGAQAVEAAASFRPELVVLDIGMPDVDGYEVARRLRADMRTRDVLIVAVTGYGRDEDRARSRKAGIDEHMTKPVDPDALIARLSDGRARVD